MELSFWSIEQSSDKVQKIRDSFSILTMSEICSLLIFEGSIKSYHMIPFPFSGPKIAISIV